MAKLWRGYSISSLWRGYQSCGLPGAGLPCGEVTRIYRLEPSGEYIVISIRLSDVCHDDIYIYIYVWPDRLLFLYSLVLKKKLFTENIYVD